MKKNIFLLAILILLSGVAKAGQTSFCAGFIAGYTQAKPHTQIAPPCPNKPLGIKTSNDYKLGFESGRLSGESPGLPNYILENLPKFPETNEALALKTVDMPWQEKQYYFQSALMSNRLKVTPGVVREVSSENPSSKSADKVANILENNQQWWGEPYGGPLYIAIYNPTKESIQRITLNYYGDTCERKIETKKFVFEIEFSEKLNSQDIGIYQFRLPPRYFSMKDEACLIIASANSDKDLTYKPSSNDNQYFFINNQLETAKKIINQKIAQGAFKNSTDQIGTLLDLATLQMSQFNYEDSLATVNQAISLASTVYRLNNPENLQLLKLKGLILNILGNHEQIIKHNQAVLERLNQIEVDDQIESLYWTYTLIESYLDGGNNEQAINLAREYFKDLFKTYKKSDLKPYYAAENLISLFQKNSRLQDAMELSKNLLDISLVNLGESSDITLNSMRSLGVLQINLGLISKALETNERTVVMSKKQLGPTNKQTLLAMDLLGRTYGSLGRYQDKLKIHELATSTWIQNYGEKAIGSTLLMNSLASSYYYLQRYEDALQLNLKIFTIDNETLALTDPKRLTTMHNIVASLQGLNRYDEASKILIQLIKVSGSLTGETSEKTLLAKILLAESLNKERKYTEALNIAQEIFKSSKTYGDVGSKLQLKSLDTMGNAYYGLEKFNEFAELIKYKVQLIEKLRSSAGLSQENRQSIFSQYEKTYKSYAIFNAMIKRTDDAFELVELSKARTLLEKMSSQTAQKFGMLTKSEYKKLEKFDQKIEENNFLLTQTDKVNDRQELEAKQNQISREYEIFQAELGKKYPKYAKLNQVTIAKPSEIARLLNPNDVGIEFITVGDSVAALSIDSNAKIEFFPLGKIPQLSDLVEILRLTYSGTSFSEVLYDLKKEVWRLDNGQLLVQNANTKAPDNSSRITSSSEIARTLSKQLIQPLSNVLKDKSNWIISPDGPLVFLPFDALPDPSGTGLILEKAQIQLTQSMSTYMLTRNLQKLYKSANNRKDLFAMGNPDYLPNSEESRNRSKISTRSSNANNMASLDENWEPLPGTEKEIRDIASIFPKSNDLYLGANATEQELQKLNASGQLKNYRYMLFSTHGNLDTTHPELSSIVLGLRNKTPQADGYVTANELTTYDLRSDLTVISACDSGVGMIMNGEGVMGLPFGLFVAGNVNTLLTLWKINDQATAEFMKRFFKKVKSGMSARESLTNTKREFMKDATFSDPKYWAPFILVGAG